MLLHLPRLQVATHVPPPKLTDSVGPVLILEHRLQVLIIVEAHSSHELFNDI